MTFSALLTQRCSIDRKVTIKNEYGHTVNDWTSIGIKIPCRIDYMFVTSSYISQTPNGQITGNDYVGYFNPNTNIRHGDRITWQNMYLYVRPINFVFGATNKVHHLEVMMGLQET